MPPDMKCTILAKYGCKAILMTTYFSQGSAATDLRGGDSFNSNFLHRSLMNITMKKCENWLTLSKL